MHKAADHDEDRQQDCRDEDVRDGPDNLVQHFRRRLGNRLNGEDIKCSDGAKNANNCGQHRRSDAGDVHRPIGQSKTLWHRVGKDEHCLGRLLHDIGDDHEDDEDQDRPENIGQIVEHVAQHAVQRLDDLRQLKPCQRLDDTDQHHDPEGGNAQTIAERLGRLAVGIDPGLAEAGLVHCRGDCPFEQEADDIGPDEDKQGKEYFWPIVLYLRDRVVPEFFHVQPFRFKRMPTHKLRTYT